MYTFWTPVWYRLSSQISSCVTLSATPCADQLRESGTAAPSLHHQMHTDSHDLISDPTCNFRLFFAKWEVSADSSQICERCLQCNLHRYSWRSFLGTLCGNTGWIDVAYNRLATDKFVMTLAAIGGYSGRVYTPHRSQHIRLRYRTARFVHQNQRRELPGSQNGSTVQCIKRSVSTIKD